MRQIGLLLPSIRASLDPVQTPTARLLELLELLQTRPLTTGREIAEVLAIDRRTVRRYIAALQELGIPVEGQRGVGGGYRVRPGFRLRRSCSPTTRRSPSCWA
jgi:predicted DNA-binding transcriptional regulator YafY